MCAAESLFLLTGSNSYELAAEVRTVLNIKSSGLLLTLCGRTLLPMPGSHFTRMLFMDF